MNDQGLMSVNEYARWVSVDPQTVRRWIKRGYLDAERVGPRLLRIDPDARVRDMPNGQRGSRPTTRRLRNAA